MCESFMASLFAVIAVGLICVVLGIISIINSKKKEDPTPKNLKKKSGIQIIVLGGLLVVAFIPAVIFYSNAEITALWLFELLLSPFCLIVLILVLMFFTYIGISFLRTGFSSKKERKRDNESIVFGFIIIALGIIVAVCFVLSFVYSAGNLIKEVKDNMQNKGSSSQPTSSIATISNYLFSVINK